jgi:hypothetical protein
MLMPSNVNVKQILFDGTLLYKSNSYDIPAKLG